MRNVSGAFQELRRSTLVDACLAFDSRVLATALANEQEPLLERCF